MDKVLVDTSVWIEFFRKKEPYYDIVSSLIDKDRVISAGLILAELIQGAKSEKELKILKDFLYVFEFVPDSVFLWEKAGELSYALQRKGKSVGLSDCYIAVSAASQNARLLTLDRHFDAIKNEAGFSFYESGRIPPRLHS